MDAMTCILWSTVFDISELAPSDERGLWSIANVVIAQVGGSAPMVIESDPGEG
jgi:hypothetical protein